MISSIRLIDGVEIIGDIIAIENNTIVVEDPLQVNYKITVMQPTPSMSLSRFMPFVANTTFEFSDQSVTHIAPVRESMATYYTHALTTYIRDLDLRIDEELINSSVDEKDTTDDYTKLLQKVELDGLPQ